MLLPKKKDALRAEFGSRATCSANNAKKTLYYRHLLPTLEERAIHVMYKDGSPDVQA